jgi:hypothetical protein
VRPKGVDPFIVGRGGEDFIAVRPIRWHALLFDRLLLFGLVDAYCGSGALLGELMMQSRNEELCMPGRIIFMRHIRRTFTYPHIRIQSRLISTDVPKRHKS